MEEGVRDFLVARSGWVTRREIRSGGRRFMLENDVVGSKRFNVRDVGGYCYRFS